MKDCPHSKNNICPLSKIKIGDTALIEKLNLPPECSNRLRELGFTEGNQIKIMSCNNNIICSLYNSRIGLSSYIADSIMVKRIK